MIEIILLLTGALVWLLIGITALLWFPLAPAFTIAWVSYKTQRKLWIRDKCVDFVAWYADLILKPIYDPLINRTL